jgi:hypothetical protein
VAHDTVPEVVKLWEWVGLIPWHMSACSVYAAVTLVEACLTSKLQAVHSVQKEGGCCLSSHLYRGFKKDVNLVH